MFPKRPQKWPEKRPDLLELPPRARDETASKETEAAAGAPPAFTAHMADVACAEGDDIALECRVAPAGDPRLQTGERRAHRHSDLQPRVGHD